MGKQRLDFEYPLTSKSANIVWEQIGSAHGLERWLADQVTDDGHGTLTFSWGEPWRVQDIRRARITEYVRHDHIRLKWETDGEDEADCYWEMRIDRSDLTGHLNLLITDFADDDDVDGLRILWESNLDRLHRASGL